MQKTKMRFFAGNTNTKGADDERNERISRRATESKMAVCVILFFTLFLLIAAPATRKTVKEGNNYISLMNR